jgi:hypothetical protein
MKKLKYYSHADFSPASVLAMKGSRKIQVVFPTHGEREASLIHDKITLMRTGLGNLIDGLFLAHRRYAETEELTERRARDAGNDVNIILVNDVRVPDMRDERGKGADMRRALYHISRNHLKGADPADVIIVFLDADASPEHFGSHFVLGLAGAVLAGHDFAKAGFWRAMGRANRYAAQPLFSLIESDGLDMLSRLSYPLSGEVAGTLDFFNRVHFWQRYGVETGINIDACLGPYRVADVNLGMYDHEHHDETAIQKMSFGVMRTFLKQLVDYGLISMGPGARISDSFRVSWIDEDGLRRREEYELEERKYPPLFDIL